MFIYYFFFNVNNDLFEICDKVVRNSFTHVNMRMRKSVVSSFMMKLLYKPQLDNIKESYFIVYNRLTLM